MIRLYKYVASEAAVLNMARGSLKFTPIDQLNDPMELVPVMDHDAVRASLAVLRKEGLSEEQFAALGRQEALLDLLAPREKVFSRPSTLAQANQMLSIIAYDDLDFMQRKLFATINSIRSRVGVMSLSERWDSLPMWAHYANIAQGYVVMLDNLDSAFLGDETGSLNAPTPISYVKDFDGMTFDPQTQNSIFFQKLSDWSYESEWRVVVPLDQCRHVEGAGLHLRDIDPRHFAGVICGWKVSVGQVTSLRQQFENVNPKARVITTSLNGSRIELSEQLEPSANA